ncbi:hypothetical protein ARALYDRAFT_899733 [Arabidopsis lyrata subsp. lyrata]|uniref:Uncharacterized protein n=1 Tax=Arabidopsis lyrata subsp. lyrata TaxID=81972 RepID=D7L3J5_ARALL|nr:hypothetical protein ARALYDRAFT_899733 [Arabidopsis lyrata subsp. lyrata]
MKLVAVLTTFTIFYGETQSHLLHGSPVNSLCADLIDPANYTCTEHNVNINGYSF